MAETIPLAVSGQILPTQEAILMSVVNSTPYYLVTDINNVPYFQPLYQDVTTGLAVFTDVATHVRIALGTRVQTHNSAVITAIKASGGGDFLVDSSLLRIVAPGSIPNATAIIPIDQLSYNDPSLVVCGYQYVISNDIKFYITNNWSATPSAQAISSLQQQPPVGSFYAFPISGLVNTEGKPAAETVYSTIYDDVLGKTAATYLFSSQQAWQAGGGEPYTYCSGGGCGSLCFGACSGNYNNCHRLKDNTFSCNISVSLRCKILSLLPFLIPSIISMGIFFGVFLEKKYMHIHPTTGKPIIGSHAYVFTMRDKIILAVTLAIPGILVIIMILLAALNTPQSNWYLRTVCRVTGDYQ